MARKKVTGSKKSIANLRKKYKAPVYEHKQFKEEENLGAEPVDPHTITPEIIKQREEEFIDKVVNKGLKPWEVGKNRPLTDTKKLTTDDIRNILIGIPMAIVAGGIAYKSAQKIGYAVTHRGAKRNIEDLKEDAKHQLTRSMRAIEKAMLARQKYWHGRRGKSYGDVED
jgi:phosphosulfolactate synthase (CoM biosynthesis protein A)